MNKANRHNDNDLRPEYDFASMKGGVRGKYVARLRKGSNLILLDPEVAAVLLAAAFAGALALPELRKAVRRGGKRACASCGRLIVLGERTCDCDR